MRLDLLSTAARPGRETSRRPAARRACSWAVVVLGALLMAAAGGASAPCVSAAEPHGVDEAVREARTLFDSGQVNAGILLLEAAREQEGDRPLLLATLGDGYRSVRLWLEAGRFYRGAVDGDSTLAGAWAGLGRVYFEQQRADSARLCLERAVRLDPADLESLGILGELALEGGDLATALRCFQEILERAGETFDALTDLAVVHERAGNWSAARPLLDRAVALYPHRAEAHYNLAILESQTGRFHQAVVSANHALDLSPGNPEVLRFLGILYFENQICAEAVRYFQQLLSVSPFDLDVRIGLASCLHALGRSDEAVLELRSALGEADEDYDLLLLIANIRLEQERLDEAMETAERAVALDSLRPDAHYLLGLTLRRLGRFEEAGRAFLEVERLKEQLEEPAGP